MHEMTLDPGKPVESIQRRARVLIWLCLVTPMAGPAGAELYSMSASGTIGLNSSTDTTIPVGTPWEFDLVYDTNAPDLDFELTGSPDPSFGRYTNGGSTPALTRFHYRAGTYEVTLASPNDFGAFSNLLVTFGGTHSIDINLNASALFPPLGGGPVSFHADFGDFSGSVFTSDALPTDTSINLADFQDASVTLLPPGGVVLGSITTMTSLKVSSVPNRDNDLFGDAYDLCPDYSTENNADVDGNGIGDECECGDQSGDGVVSVLDLVSINLAIFGAVPVSPLCDTNNDLQCNVQDIVGANLRIFGQPAYCSRYPPPAGP